MPTALKIVIKRGQLMSSMPSGNMMAVQTSIDKLKSLTDTAFEIAADNAPEFCTISFKSENTDKVKALLDKNEIRYIPLNTSHAFHSAAFDPIISEFSDYVNQFRLNPPELPFISCFTGLLITPEQATSGSYWAKQLRNTVQFNKGIETIAADKDVVFLEVGPNTHLSSLIRQNKEVPNKKMVTTTLGKPDDIDERYKVVTALGNIHAIGINIDFSILIKDSKPAKINLPSYPFEKKRHWIEADMSQSMAEITSEVKHKESGTPLSADIVSFDSDSESLSTSDKATDKILKIWKSMIGSEEIGLDDDFFEIGGHSLLALQILTRIKEELGFKITLKDFLENPTINKLNDRFIKEDTVRGKTG